MQDQFSLSALHPVLRDHVVHGLHVLPGLAYIDLLHQALRDQGLDYREWSLRNLSIYHPLSIAAGEELLIELDRLPLDDGTWRIEIHGQDTPAGGPRRRYCSALLSASEPERFDETLDLEAVLASGAERTSLDLIYRQCREQGLVHGGFMQPCGARYATADAIYIDCAVDPAFSHEGMDLMFHPALLDGCAIGVGSVADAPGAGVPALFLPIAIESFRASHLLPDRCVARIRIDGMKLQQDLFSMTLELFDDAGAKVAELKNLTIKAVRDPSLLDPASARDQRAAAISPAAKPRRATPAPDPSPATATADGELRRQLQEFLQRIIAQRLGMAAAQIDARAGFYDLGLDSASLLELVHVVEGRLQVPLPPTLLFEHTNVRDLAEHLSASYGAQWRGSDRPQRAGSEVVHAAAATVQAAPAARVPVPREAGDAADIAIIGMAGRFPQAADVRELWANLLAAKDCVTEVPASRWDWRVLDEVKSVSGKDMSRWGGFIADAECFDAEFFHILPREAEMMDPQERQFLEVAWAAIEDAGYTPATLVERGEDGRRRSVGVFAGTMHKDYALVGAQRLQQRQVVSLSLSAGMIANRVSYFCNFHGPSITIDTLCSSSLTAVHLALESVRHGECEVALAGGVNLSLHPAKYLTYGIADMHASDGRCRSFGAGGDGYVSAEGVGVVVLKPLRKALADRDAVYAVVKGSAVNHVGAVGGATVPSPTAQADVIRQCLHKVGFAARTISYVEAHGTGTSLGDPIEIEGLSKAFRHDTQDVGFCAIGSLKSNIGHAEAASGVAGLIKAALQLKHRVLVASLHAQTLNPHIDWPRSPFVVQSRTEKWRRPKHRENGSVVTYPRRASLSSFGATGSNAHVILEELREPGEPSDFAEPAVVVLSARNADRLRAQAQRLLAHLDHDDVALADLAYTLQVGREAFNHRLAIVTADTAQLKARLTSFVETGTARADEDCFVGDCRQFRDAVGLLTDDEDSAELVAKWLAKGKLRKIAQLWIKGFEVEWRRLYGPAAPRRVHLPGYAFARPRYWLPDAEPATAMDAAPGGTRPAAIPDVAAPQSMLLTPQWEPSSPLSPAAVVGEHWVLFAGWPDEVSTQTWPAARVETLADAGGDKAGRFEHYGWQLLQRVQSWLHGRPHTPLLIQIVIPAGEETLYALSGLLKTARLEQPLLCGQVVGVEAVADAGRLAAQLAQCAASDAAELRCTGMATRQRHYRPLPDRSPGGAVAAVRPWKRDGVYLITGGGGGLGRIVAEAIGRDVGTATVVLAGRSAPRDLPQAAGLTVDYRRADVSDAAAVEQLVAAIIARYGRLDGIVHSAGVLRDGFLLRKSQAQYREVMAPKVRGVVNLDRATRHLSLDAFVLFSSATGAHGNLGQGDYALANAFLDAYAHERTQAVARGECQGRTVSIGWPLWADGGMQVGIERREAMRALGADAMPTAQGLEALHRAYDSGAAQVQVLYGTVSAPVVPDAAPAPAAWTGEASPLRPRTQQQLRRLFGAVTKLDVAQIDVAEPLESYGIDSIVIMQLNTRLTGIFGELSKTLFYEYPTLAELGDFLVREHAATCERWCGMLEAPALPAAPAPASQAAAPLVAPAMQTAAPAPQAAAPPVAPAARVAAPIAPAEPVVPSSRAIAVIGLAGRYPQARDVDAYWDNLRDGRDGITEIPAERWPIEGFFEPDMERAIASGRSYGKWGGFIDGFAEFDALFFSISPREAMNVDPQVRLFLETCWAAMEDAGYTRERFASAHQRRVGVFAGITKTGFELYGPELWRRGETVTPWTSFSSLANRVSYALNLQGPSLPIDTMCSASLTAIHEACEHLLRDDCALAFAGGVNLYLHPANYAMLCSNRMLSASGRCHSFGSGGDGFVPGEGVGVVLLKPLAQAVADRDPIHGVIRATGINHDGKTNGYTVPNPVAQRDLIAATLTKAGIDARTVSYIEAHGTGTSLGDPIEITGLTQAFARHTADRQFCAIGSVKSNIGHAESAAGIAGLTKVLLQMKHRQLVPSLHVQTLNPNIDFSTTPFVVQRTLADWERPQVTTGGSTVEYPRIAGISSFGAGGANAHVIVEEYVAPDEAPFMRSGPVLCVLSARSEERLKARAQQLLDAIRRRGLADADLADIAYTLQVGREAMDHRLAFTADTPAALSGLLQRYVGGDTAVDGLHRGEVKRNKEALSTLTEDDDFDQTIDRWLARGKYTKVLELWVKGLAFDWTRLYPHGTPRIIALPTYPFARETHWLPLVGTTEAPAAAVGAVDKLHPLLHANTSTLEQQRYSSLFTGEEFFLADHRVHGSGMLPGVAYLEMAQQAVGLALERDGHAADGRAFTLKDVVWVRPLRIEAPTAVHVRLDPLESGEVGFEVYTQKDIDDGAEGDRRLVHARGRVELSQARPRERVDLSALQQQCDRLVDAGECYAAFDASGVNYGPGHRGIRSLQVGADGTSRFVLAQLALPEGAGAHQGSYVLHPGILDSALQASIGFAFGATPAGAPSGRDAPAAMPFAIDDIEILGATPAQGFALVRSRATQDAQTRKFDVDVCDGDGEIRVRIRGFVCRPLASPDASPDTRAREATEAVQAVTSLLLPRWDAVARPFVDAWPALSARLLVVGGSAGQQQALRERNAHTQVLDAAEDSAIDTLVSALSAHEPVDHVVWIAAPLSAAPDEEPLIDAQEHGVIALFRLVKALLASGYGARALGWTVLTTQSQQITAADVVAPAHAGIHGFIGSLAKEYAHWAVRLIDLPAGEEIDIDELLRLPANATGDAWACRHGEWFRQQLLRFEPAASAVPAFRDGGVYVLIGGAGGLGEVFSEYLIRRHRAQVVWIGRRAIDEAIGRSVRRLSALGPEPLYVQADAADRDDLARARREIRARHARIDGIVHSAIVLLDKSIANMEEDRLRAALRAKVDVSVRIAQVFAHDEPDFVLFFSALQSFVKSAGQSNYAAGCTFKDAFAHALNAVWPSAVKVVNWGFWGSVGTVSSEYYRQRMQQSGIGSIEPGEGLRALESLFGSSVPQLAVVTTLAPQALAALSAEAYVQALPAPAAGSGLVASDRIDVIPAELIGGDASLAWQAEFYEQLLLVLYAQLRRLGLFDEPLPLPAAASVRRWFAAGGLRAMYERWIVHSVRLLTEAGLLRESEVGLVAGARAPLDIDAVWSQWDDRCAAWRDQTGTGAQIGLIDTTLRALPDVLTGRRLATDFLFPQSTMGSVESVYRRNALADHFNAVLAEDLVDQVRHLLSRDPQRRLRILEIGAGTGGTSAMVFEKLRPFEGSIDEYTYTDISKSFLLHAEEHFAPAVPYLRCRLFNVEQPLRNQSVEAGSYDFAIATNVLHATRNIRTTLRNTKAALRSGGLLLLNEINSFNLYTHLTFGLLEGWWLFEDEALRIPGTPALHPAAWRHVLEAEGFDAVHFPAEAAHGLGQQIVTARSDGLVTQAVTASRTPAGAAAAGIPPAPGPRAVPAPKPAPVPAQRPAGDRASQEEFVRRTVAETIAAALKVSADLVDADEPFADYGLDSILGVHAVHVISQLLGIALNTTALFDHSTVTKLTAHILAEHAPRADIGAAAGPTAEPAVENARAADAASAPPLRSRFAVAGTARSAAAVPAAAAPVAAVAATPADGGGPRPPQPVAAAREPIAIVGMSARYPHCDDVEQLWQHLIDGDDLIDEPGEGRGLPRGVVSGIDQFDALFFNISGVEATYMDPQQRLFLEESWKALEDAGYVGDAIEGSRCGVYLGSTMGDYGALMPQSRIPPQAFWGNSGAITPARIAYFLDLQGPAVAIDTACSSSLVAMHMGCQALRAGEVALALAGGVFIQSSPAFQMSAGNAGMLSPNGRCYTFDDRADGFVASEGVGVVVLKRLSDALAAHDQIYGVIRGSGINQDGATNGITAPSALSQERLECDVYDTFGIDPSQITLIEAHGTGTKLGDPIEFQALTKAFRRYTRERQFCAIGSIKTNLGHAAVAAGVAGVIKVLLSLKYEQIPASLHFATGNGHIDFAGSPFYVNTALRPWPASPARRRLAAVSSFGFSGTNAHLVIEEAPVVERARVERPAYLIVLSARTAEQLRAQAGRLLAQVERDDTRVLGDIAYTLLAGRRHFVHRLACVAGDRAALTAALTRWLAGSAGESVHVGEIKDKSSRERAALKDYGQACLAACVEGSLTAADYRQKLGVLADLHVQGYALDLAALLADGGFGRVSLPTYPFARQRYWVEAAVAPIAAPVAAAAGSALPAQAGNAATAIVDAAATEGDDPVGALTLVPQWNLLSADAVTARSVSAGRLLIIEDDTSRHAALRARYPDAVVIDLDEATVESLAAQLSAELGDTLVWCAPPAQRDTSADAVIAGQEHGVMRGLLLLQALLRAGYGERPLALSVITQLAQAVVPGEAIDATQASIWGLIGSAAKEQPAWQVRLLDVETAAEREALIGSGLQHSADPHGNGRALRGGRWYGQVCVPCTLPAPAQPVYRRNGVYVVIGGAGGVGAVLTEHLIRHYQARVIWLGRRDLDDAIRAQQQHLAQWGEAPEYLAVDARDGAALQVARDTIVARYGVIHGVVHAALVMSGSDLAQMSAERFRAGLSAKVDVSVRLVEAFAGAVQDFVVWFSSIQALEKTRRQSNYAAGSTFVDAYATQVRERLGCAVKVIDWGYWASTGVASAMPSFQNWLVQAGMSAIEPAAGLAVLEQLIASPLAHVAYLNTHRAGALQGVTFAPERVRVATVAAPVAIGGFVPTPFAAEAGSTAADPRVQELQTLLLDMIVCRLSEIGPAEICETFDAWRARSSLAAEFERWFDATARLLVQRYGSDAAVLAALAAPDDTAPERWRQWVQFGRDHAQLALVEGTLAVLPAILRGEQSATAVLFPQATMQRVEGVYQGNPVTDYANAVVAQAARHYVEARLAQDPTARLRLIEIGAGTGGTSAVVFEALADYAAHIDEYAYTDVSKAFLHHAQERFAPTTPYLRGRVFDAERGPAEQGIAADYDIAIATNVLHATRDIREALRHVKAALRGQGIVLLHELTASSLLGHLTFGLLPGWWRFEDAALRVPGGPLVAPENWERALTAEGYGAIGFLTPVLHESTQVIIAQSDGVAHEPRQVQAAAPAAPASAAPVPATTIAPAAVVAAPVVSSAFVSAHVRQVVLERLAEALMIELAQIRPDASFAEYGLDSLLGVRTVEAINATLGTTLTSTSVFDFSSVNALTEQIMATDGTRLAAMLGVGTAPSHAVAASEPAPVRTEAPAPVHVDTAAPAAAPSAPRIVTTLPVDTAVPPAIAVIGMSGRYPQSRDLSALWDHLAAGDDLTEPVTRWDLPALLGDTPFCPRGGFLDGIAEFDALFFNISGLEATYMDPQQRLFLQESWKALEDAGYVGASIAGRRCGVYAGYNGGDYHSLATGPAPAQALWGTATSMVSARIAYYLDLQGPAITIDTACSSSLVAIHLASQALRTGEVDLALAGGVFVQCAPSLYVGGERAGMLSPHGRCYTFDERADGFVPGEGVGAVVLKRLDEALADGDHLYGVIRGSGINQDGATNGITAPSARSQERLEREVYERFGIDPDGIGLVEAHGTGTKLGDPIEFHALTRAFRQHTPREGYCAIGSIKSNLGHTTAASGVAGVLKVLLCLKHRQIAPSVNYSQSNRHIAFAGSPFYVPTKVEAWEPQPGHQRRATVSAFGLSGTNAHVVIEEAPAHARTSALRPGHLIVLSARSAAQLRQQAQRLIAHGEQHADLDLGHISYTLLVGRRHFEHRLACVVRSAAELAARLQTWLTHGKAPQVYAAKSVELDDGGQAGLKRYGQQCLADCAGSLPESEHLERLAAVAELHVQGYALDYAALFAGQSPARLSLPTYPFATTQYWVEMRPGVAMPVAKTTARATLHPLVHENTSDFWRQRYSSVFTGAEMQFDDHRVQGRRLLPGVAYLEMVHAAVSRSSGLQGFAGDPDRTQRQETVTAMVMRNVVWLRPVVAAGDSTPISITLVENDAGEIEFEIFSQDHAGSHPAGDEPSPHTHTHAQGRAILAANIDDAMPGSYRRIDLDRLRSNRSRSIDVDDCYAVYSSVGIEYGPAHRSLESVDIGTDSLGPYVMAEVRLPECTLDTQRQYALHPSILDGALQAALALEFADEQAASQAPRGPVVPFALEEAVITQRSPERAFVHIRAADSERVTPGLRKMNIDICDSAGRICVELRGISSRELRTDARGGDVAATQPVDPQAADDAVSGVLLAPCWETETPALEAEAAASRLCLIGGPGSAGKCRALQEMHPTAHLLEVGADATIDTIAGQLAALPSLEHVVWIAPTNTGDQTLSAAQSACILGCFRTIKALLGLGHGDRPFELTVVTTQASIIDAQQPVNAAHAGIHGLIGSLAKEYEHWKVRLLDLPADEPWPYDRLLRMPVDGQGSVWAYRDSEWLQQQMLPCDVDSREYAYRDGGVYVIVGGAGGLGEVLSEHLVREYRAQVVWLGRRECDDTIRRKIERLAQIGGPAPHYVRADATQRGDVERAHREIKERHGHIHGIVHSAIALLDKSLANMDEQRFCEGLAPKVEASIHLAEIFGDEPLDFALFFSSFQSFARARGQANYAAGCTFKDAFAHELARSWRCPVKVMNWGYWGSVGIVASADTQQRMAQLGVDSIEPAEGIAALDRLLAGPFTQLAFMKPVRAAGTPEAAPAQIVELPADAPAVDVSIFSKRRVAHGA